MNKTPVRVLVLLVFGGVLLFGAVRPAQALVGGVSPYCLNPESTIYEELYGYPIPPFYNAAHYNRFCQNGFGQADAPEAGKPASLSLFDGFASATIDPVPGTNFKAFLYPHVPQPGIVPEGWYIYGYGVDIFYDDGNVNPEGTVCFKLPPGMAGNFELGVFSYKNGNFQRLSGSNCGWFTGGGSFFLLTKTNPVPFFSNTELGGP